MSESEQVKFLESVNQKGPLSPRRPDLKRCWTWEGRKDRGGYGRAKNPRNGLWEGAHRLSYKLFVGKIPPLFQVDHLCFNRNCVRPTHLEAVTPRENMERAYETVNAWRRDFT